MINKKQFKFLAVFIVCAMAVIAGYIIFVQAQFVTEDFTTETNIAATWQTTVATTTGQVTLELRDCDVGAAVWFCNASTTCANYLEDGDYILVAQADLATTKQWKTANTACNRPECGADGGQNGDNLVADNTVNFATNGYTARNACKDIGGRLPTKDELNCIYTNKVTFGDSFADGYYWSSTEYSATNAWTQYFTTGNQYNTNKTYSDYVRCVRGW
ncbi:DUF1566 domain-containing protein [Candidatus Parcubacteria bacterium]|nr:DUF1566 domain-containing protein [Candidatus Parcubacteria bacterium]MCG2701180.1 DUF1566 domain-containing protein [Candidatus Parcubacteria bacterium]